jgi:hypothetical protein
MVTIMPRIPADVRAPPAPWMKRAMMSRFWLSARPQNGGRCEHDQSGEKESLAAEQIAQSSG